MKIFIDIGHPAHVHYFRNFIKIMESKGHTFFISSREKECTSELLQSYDLPFFSRGKGKNGIIGKLLYMLKADYILYKKALKFKPDYFLSFGSPYAAQVSWLLQKPHIACDDTEHVKFSRMLYKPFTKVVFTPFGYLKNLGTKQISFNSFMELCSLHPNYYSPDSSIYNILGITQNEPYIMLRFVSWNANHDIGEVGLNLETKMTLVNMLKQKFKIFISSEGELPEGLKQYKIKIPVQRMHDALAFSTLFIGEGATMASECAMLGIPAIYVNSLDAGTLQAQEKFGLIFGFRNSVGVIEKAKELIANENLRAEFKIKRDKMLSKMIDPTEMLVNYFENYQNATKTIK